MSFGRYKNNCTFKIPKTEKCMQCQLSCHLLSIPRIFWETRVHDFRVTVHHILGSCWVVVDGLKNKTLENPNQFATGLGNKNHSGEQLCSGNQYSSVHTRHHSLLPPHTKVSAHHQWSSWPSWWGSPWSHCPSFSASSLLRPNISVTQTQQDSGRICSYGQFSSQSVI